MGTSGDPHLSTFDGTFYTFNGHGEYILLRVNNGVDLEFQGRMLPIVDSEGRKTKATTLTALAVKTADSDTVQVKMRQIIVTHASYLTVNETRLTMVVWTMQHGIFSKCVCFYYPYQRNNGNFFKFWNN